MPHAAFAMDPFQQSLQVEHQVTRTLGAQEQLLPLPMAFAPIRTPLRLPIQKAVPTLLLFL